jgi:hypothetical protein
MSLSDLARRYNCTRQYVHKLLKQFGIERRDKRAARILALNQGKLYYSRTDEIGNKSKVTLQKITINKDFFKLWTPAMAYVLGVIYTDGNLIPGRNRDASYTGGVSRFTVAQKEPELLEKVLALMDCNAKLYRGTQQLTGNAFYQFHINDESTYDDLLRLGLKPKKSLTLEFPQMPGVYVRHFIRGCWDGDGSVYFEKKGSACASFISGSRIFVEGMISQLDKLGLPPRTIYRSKTNKAYNCRYSGDKQCGRLFHIFYHGVPDTMYLSRKYERFRQVAARHEGTQAVSGFVFPIHSGSVFVEPIPVADDYSKSVAPPSHLNIEHNENVLGNPRKSDFAFPEPFTRTLLGQILKISPRKVSLIMQSMPIAKGIQKLSEVSDTSSNKFKVGVRKLRNQVNMYLSHKDDDG